MKEKSMTVEQMIAALQLAKKELEVEKYVDSVLEDMNEQDLYCTNVLQTKDNDGDVVY